MRIQTLYQFKNVNIYSKNTKFLREVVLHYYIAKKTAAKTHHLLVEIDVKHSNLITTCKDWFCRFRNGNY